ncbi:MAG TPA: transcription elongation factor GreA [Chloroflexota bacterium]
MAKETVFLTAKGKAELESELDELLTVKRPAIAAAILAAREDGDLRENGAYHDAKDRQGLMEGRIRELRDKLERAAIIDHAASAELVELGSTVTIADPSGDQATYTIVGSMEANVKAGRISNVSPMGQALMGKRVGDEANVRTPRGDMVFSLTAIS